MSIQDKKQKKNYILNSRPIISLLLGLGFLSAVLLMTMFITGESAPHGTGFADSTDKEQEESETGISSSEEIGVITAINTATKELTLYDVLKEETVTFTYSGGTNILDKFGQVIADSQLSIGIMVEALHEKNQTKLSDIKISTKAWEYVGVNNLSVDRSSRVMKIATTKYKYTDDIIILDGQDFTTVNNLAEQDELTIRGYEETIWSITITRGHGTVKLKEYESFIGDSITIGYETMQQIAKDMVIMVREGNFNLTVENALYTATKNITVYRNQETIVSLSDLGPDAAKQGRVTFKITPFGADLFIDRKLATYANPLELIYGEHDIVVSLEGYTTYEGKLKVDTAGKVMRIDLPVETSDEAATVSETDTDTDDANANTDPDNANTDTDNTDAQNGDTTDGQDNTANEDLEVDDDHLIYVQNPVGASIYLNGEFMGISPGSFKKVIGSHVLTFIAEGYVTMSYTVEVSDDNLDTYFNMPDLVKED
jgi:hypothetical protein